ncbi:xylan 1,4-beta-xylosidase [Nitrospirillum amazonense]|uniref:Xylan 1,4-beta-xylosidase n=1 Tax=Nitrospirillum amazonense TaxID=28077 RepID=A0A560FFB0_9PROT|nr:beta-xylosidase [Nitrospirillum amazonense]TWB20297.1 xylan 1,4-beta-xylosidase [Nitrospirillum amazonense]
MAARGWRSEDGRKGQAARRRRRVRTLAAGLLALSLSPRPGLAQPMPTPVSITVDLAHPVGPTHPLYAWFGYDEANYTTMRDGRALLTELHDLAPVPVHIRTHHLLSSGDGVAALKWSSTNVYSEDAAGNPVYDFHILDGIFDAYRDAGVVPMVELGFTPKALASGAGPYEDVYPDAAIGGTVHSPPKDPAKWRALIRTVVAHLAERYGREAVAGWYFEVWNEPDIPYWHGTPTQYFQLYDTTVAAVRDVLPQAKVGGPATTGPGGASGAQFLKDFLDHVAATQVPLDFISFHAKGQPTFQDGQVTMGLAQELTDVDKGFALIAGHPEFRPLPIILSEADPEGCAACSMTVNPANAYRNGALYPAYTAAAYKRLFELADRHGVNLAAMLSWSFEFEGRAYFEGFRDLSTNGIDKPILNFFRMAAMLRGTRVATAGATIRTAADIIAHGVRDAPDIDALATADARGAAVMVWNYHDAATPADPTPVALSLTGLPKAAARVRLSHYRIDDRHSNAYTAWQAMGSPQNPTPAQLAELKGQAGLQLMESPRWLAPSGGTAILTLDMPRQSVSLLALDW